MPLSRRSRLSFAQFLSLQGNDVLALLLNKYDFRFDTRPTVAEWLARVCLESDERQLAPMLDEVGRTSGDLRSRVNPKYRYDERMAELQRSLELDGYRLAAEGLRQIEPTIDGQAVYEDDLTRALRTCDLPDAADVLAALEQSADAFRREPPDYNAALTNARIALQTLATSIATRRAGGAVGFDPARWGQVVANLRVTGFITPSEEEGLTGVFSFVSQGAHAHVNRSEQEMARLGRSMVVSMCYFLIKSYTG